MITEVTAVAFRQRLGEMISQVQYGGNSVVVTKDGDRVAALVDVALFDRIRAMRDRFATYVAEATKKSLYGDWINQFAKDHPVPKM